MHRASTYARREAPRFLRFLVVSLSGLVIDFGLLWGLKSAGLHTLLANSIAFSTAAGSNFFWNRIWTFRAARKRPWPVQLVQFLSVSLIGLAMNDLIVVLLQAPLGTLLSHPEQGYLAAKVVATGVTVVWNYFGNRHWTFGETSTESQQSGRER